MSERRTVLSRPRTKVYNCNYDIGERHYKSMIDELDRKYGTSGGPPAAAPPATSTVSDRFRDEDALLRTRAKTQSALEDFENLYDERRSKFNTERASSSRSSIDDFDNEVSASLKRLRAAKMRMAKESSLESDFESTFSHRLNGSKLKLSEKLLDSVGINGRMQEALEENILSKKKSSTATSLLSEFEQEPSFTKWTALKSLDSEDSVDSSMAARARAKQSKARLSDLDAEMEELAERGAARERRAQDLRALLAENDLLSEESVKVNKKFSNKKVMF